MLLATINLHPFEIVSRIFSCAEDGLSNCRNQKTYPKKVGKTVSLLCGSWEDNENYLFGYILFITIHLKYACILCAQTFCLISRGRACLKKGTSTSSQWGIIRPYPRSCLPWVWCCESVLPWSRMAASVGTRELLGYAPSENFEFWKP